MSEINRRVAALVSRSRIARTVREYEFILSEAREIRREIENVILKLPKDVDLKKLARTDALEFASSPEIETKFKRRLLSAFLSAAKSAKEYNYPLFISSMQSAIRRARDFIHVDSNLNAHIDMAHIAGRLEDYAQAVEMARVALGVKDTTPVQASFAWKHIIYGIGREGKRHVRKKKDGTIVDRTDEYAELYRETIATRLSLGKASWWELLEYGNTDSPVTFRKAGKGTPYPQNSGKFFVRNTEKALSAEIKAKYEKNIAEYRDAIKKEENGFRRLLLSIIDFISKVEVKIVLMKDTEALAKRTRTPKPKSLAEKIEENLLQQITRSNKIDLLDKDTLRQVSQWLASGNVNKGGTVTIGHGFRVRYKDAVTRAKRELGLR